MYTFEVSEPVLALAAHRILMDEIIPWKTAIEKFILTAVRSTTSIGFRGEVAAQVLCLMAWQVVLKSRKVIYEFPCIPLWDYINALLGDLKSQLAEEDVVSLKAVFKTHVVRVNQFVKTFAPPSATMLKEYFLRASAVYCVENQAVIDLAIPAADLLTDDGAYDKKAVSDEVMSTIGIQVRLKGAYASSGALSEWVTRLRKLPFLKTAKKPFLGIFLEFGPSSDHFPRDQPLPSEPGEVWYDHVKNCHALFIRRLLPGNIFHAWDATKKADLDSVFRTLLHSHVDPSQFPNVDSFVRNEICDMFECQPYMSSTKQ